MCSKCNLYAILFAGDFMSIADNIKYLRKKNKLTQKKLAELTGLAVITIQNYEAGKYEPKNESLYKLRKAFDCNIYELLDKPFDGTYARLPDDDDMDEYLHYSTKKADSLLSHFDKLNENGQDEAVKRVQELTEIPKYTE